MKVPLSITLLALSLAPATLVARAQSQPPEKSVAELARESREKREAQQKNGTRTRAVITDENLVTRKGPIPAIQIAGADNSEDILAAIADFRATHTPRETEDAIRAWYEDHDRQLVLAIEENSRLEQVRGQGGHNDSFQSSGDYRQDRERQMLVYRNIAGDVSAYRENGLLIARIQQAFGRVRAGLRLKGITYDWMKIRFANGNGSW
jgi:hypothetical protein